MALDEEEDKTAIYKVVVNRDKEYSIWPVERENPLGWKDAGRQGLRRECLAYIEELRAEVRSLR